jgi:hypothetical protein
MAFREVSSRVFKRVPMLSSRLAENPPDGGFS